MAVWDLYSKRKQRAQRAGGEEVFVYDELPEAFRIQVIHIWESTLGPWRERTSTGLPLPAYPPNHWWVDLYKAFVREKGLWRLIPEHLGANDPTAECRYYLVSADVDDALDLIEWTFKVINNVVRAVPQQRRATLGLVSPDDAIAELNLRFREHGIGYEFSADQINRIDSHYLHAEAMRPALNLLRDGGAGFSGPLEEFRRAHDFHRRGDPKEAIVNAGRAFESTMKAICTARGWHYDPHKDNAKDLISIVFANGLLPLWLQSHFTALRSVLECGLPTVRNRTSGHGQGPTPTEVPGHFAAYALHLAAANIVILVEAHRAMR